MNALNTPEQVIYSEKVCFSALFNILNTPQVLNYDLRTSALNIFPNLLAVNIIIVLCHIVSYCLQ